MSQICSLTLLSNNINNSPSLPLQATFDLLIPVTRCITILQVKALLRVCRSKTYYFTHEEIVYKLMETEKLHSITVSMEQHTIQMNVSIQQVLDNYNKYCKLYPRDMYDALLIVNSHELKIAINHNVTIPMPDDIIRDALPSPAHHV